MTAARRRSTLASSCEEITNALEHEAREPLVRTERPQDGMAIGRADSAWPATHEVRGARRHPATLGEAHAGDGQLVERLDQPPWALVDGLVADIAGALVARHPELGDVLDRWAVDADFWVRRAALLALLVPLRRGNGDFERFCRYADAMLEEREFFIRKAIGWVLREVGKSSPGLVYAWLAPRRDRVSGVTLREAVKYLNPERRERLMAAYRGRRAAP